MTAFSFPFSVIRGGTVHRLVFADLDGCCELVARAYLAHDGGCTVNPPSTFLRFKDRPNARIIALPAHLSGEWRVSGIKWIASYPDNVADGIPRASAVLLLNDHDRGYPFACLEASVISAARTAASAALAALHLHGRARRVAAMGIVGTGLIARYVYQFLVGTGWEIRHLNLYDSVAGMAERFCDAVGLQRDDGISIAGDAGTAIRNSDLILFATTASRPHVFDADDFAHRPVVLHLSLRDLAPELLLDAVNIVDDVDHVMQAETSAHLAEQIAGTRDFVTGTLADVLRGRCAVDRSKPVVFSPFGLGLLDVALGKWVYDRAVEADECLPVDDFFHELQR